MRSSISSGLIWLVSSVIVAVSANEALATITPCPLCPLSVAPAVVTVTSQYQPISAYVPSKTCTAEGNKTACATVPSLVHEYQYVSTVIPCLEEKSSCTITKTDQIVPLQYRSTVITAEVPCKTPANFSTCTPETDVHTRITNIYAPFNKLGPMGSTGYGGSGLCKDCGPDADGNGFQDVDVVDCTDGQCATHTQTWVSRKPSTTEATEPISFATQCTTTGAHTIPITTTYQPSDTMYDPATTTVYYTTTITDAPTYIDVTTTITLSLTETICLYDTVISGFTIPPTSPAIGPASAPASSTGNPTSLPSPQLETNAYPTYPTPTPNSNVPSVGDKCDYAGCFDSTNNVFFPTFNMADSSGKMTIRMCIDNCQALGKPYSGLYRTDCYCGYSIEHATEHARSDCAASCPGNHTETCGGGDQVNGLYLLDIYDCSAPSPTETSGSEISSSTPEPSSDPDPEPEKRNINADIQTSRPHPHAINARQGAPQKLRRGGMVKAVQGHKVVGGANSQKRDLGLKKNSLLDRA
ncbi:hypothetical protein BP5796_10542 [Coleophoma crateriformis]|uniref:WSC domain-containing protein n=1 Tax=Coleophoma crateriformis TaxID=565419 RepID=A0A3D8QQX0_9HELO|nr:hypothetical protein BP5796_10542 [Coleophoma crateriformis]